MRISDWCSDVCSSDLPAATAAHSGGIYLVAGPVGRGLLLFALPMLGSNILQSLNGSINSMWVGRFLGARALAATTSANLIMFLLFAGVFGLAMARSEERRVGKECVIRVDLGGRRIINKKQ